MGEKQKADLSVRKGKLRMDGLQKKDRRIKFFDLPLARFVGKYKNSSILLSRRGRTGVFYTEDSKLYITPDEYRRMEKGEKIVRVSNRMDSALSRNFEKTRIYSIGHKDIIYLNIRRRYSSLRNYLTDLISGSVQGVSVTKMWNLSIVGAVIFGMLTMTMIYRYLGQGVSAQIRDDAQVVQAQQNGNLDSGSNILDANSKDDGAGNIDTAFITKLLGNSGKNVNSGLEREISQMVKGYPIEDMVPEIAKQDRIVAAFIIAIAKKESNWGIHVPVYKGQNCYNYWGYRGKNPVGTGGHTCFDSPKDAVDTVAKRIKFLVSNEKLNTPDKMVVWKCGYDCSWDNPADVAKWASDVSIYFDKLNKN